ncbi:Uncharacterised protein [Mycobacteroides abscessus subsp. abscessus]|uniref:Transmembrane protein n=4 Tax=Mycobacteriaceae TaxID=1762 RepID=A0A1U1Q1H3_9MYCO|nr:hypothetical protein [Mycobacteroides abscessus]SKM83794.1 Uncharacterised protein [Mycobacteroides abscessus subsp. massiliense]QOF39521.1 hypothetical protein E3G66_003725 [Mycobacteroides abscessus]SHP06058.1 Uncharacterised protein [Mycobacteroides abscessus subsp. abscessus]SHP20670.1 Uncharacterised protein [Mycobacteroides abscessus subsp. abscessus]SHP91594.1 Uncharacterised protein [Mycobacteroides abscessus subsp. abscessus]
MMSDMTDEGMRGRRVVPVSFVDVAVLGPVLFPLGFAALAVAGFVPLLLTKACLLAILYLPGVVGQALFLGALLVGLWSGYRIALLVFRTEAVLLLMWWKGLSWRDFRSAELLPPTYGQINTTGYKQAAD